MQLSNVIDRAVPALPVGAAVLQVLTLGLERETFALETEMVREVLDRVPISEVPNARPFVRGLINVRGKVVPVVDLKRKFGMGATEATTDSRVIVLEIELKGQPVLIGLLADRVYEVVELPAAALETAPTLGMRWRAEFIRAIGKRGEDFIIVLDIERVFASEESPLHRPQGKIE